MDERNPYRRAPRDPEAQSKTRKPKAEPATPRKGLRQLPRELQDLAEGRIDRLPRARRDPGPLEDTREGAVIAGVRNSEARVVYDARVSALRQALTTGRHQELVDGLREVKQLALWRARNVTDFKAFSESIVGVPADSDLLAPLADLGLESAPLPPEAVALLIRIESALLARPPGGKVQLRHDPAVDGLVMTIAVPVQDVPLAVEAFSDVGRAASALRRFIRRDSLPPPSPERRFDDRDRPRGRETGGWQSREPSGEGPRRGGGEGPRRHGSAGPARPPFRDRGPRPPARRKP
ncbi:MAG TPA: hypothetical protein VGI70_19005 [Polyangiales bacterium]|jgi:hypothetical protein